MATFTQAVKRAVRTAWCTSLRNTPEWFSALREIVIPDSLAAAADAFNRAVCDSTDNAEDFVPQPPFFGGQCAGQRYQVSMSGLLNNLQPTSFNVIAFGPIVGIDTSPVNAGGFFTPQLVSSGGAQRTTLITTGQEQVRDSYSIGQIVCLDDLNIVIPCPQDCGNPPTEFPEPGPIVVNPPDIIFDDDDGNPVTVPITLIFAPVIVRANATISIPLNIDVGGVKLVGNFNLFPNTNIELFPDLVINRPGTPDNPDLTDPETGTEGEPDEEEENDSRDPIVAVVVRSNKDGFTRASEVAQDSLPTLFAPRLGNVSFFVTTGRLSAWTPPQPIQFTDQHLPCPSPYGARDVKVWWDAGWTGSFSAIRGKPLGELD